MMGAIAKMVGTTVGSAVVVLLLLTYGRWEWLTWRHGAAFRQAIARSLEEEVYCYVAAPKALKVLQYRDLSARAFVKDETDSTYLVNFVKDTAGNWQFHNQGICYIETVKTTQGGSADGCFYWYFWLC
ncbi:MAG: hypothetical protein HC925_04260 [Coleofasciculaceae cyanobacterium SM2_3_26]|nr:hypothetical protein [Coleofasciculaceae cyanobacterium SM2_3_26]